MRSDAERGRPARAALVQLLLVTGLGEPPALGRTRSSGRSEQRQGGGWRSERTDQRSQATHFESVDELVAQNMELAFRSQSISRQS